MKISVENIDEGAIRRAAQIVDEGGLVGFPTETVYGIACRVSTESLEKLSRIKGRDAQKFYTLHIGRKEDVGKYVPTMRLRASKLVQRAWPGALTIVFELSEGDLELQRRRLASEVFENLYKDHSIGIRCPDNAVASRLLLYAQYPVVAPSANISGQPPATDAEQVLRQFGGQIDMLLDAGPSRFGTSSTVVKVTSGGLEILREGAYPAAEVAQNAQINVLFVCTGNSCRSPMAAGMFRKYLAEKLGCAVDRLKERGYKITSAGTMGLVGLPASSEAIRACASRGIDISEHQSTALNQYLIDESDLVFALSRVHQETVVEMSGTAGNKCMLLADDKDIADPIGQSQRVYNDCAELIEQAVRKRIGELVL